VSRAARRAATRRRAFLAAAALLGSLVTAAGARADYRESYRKGIEAVDRGNWAEAAKRMREALAEQPREGERLKLYGMRFEDYLPHYYLGLALYNAKDCQGALQAWQVSDSQGAVRKTGRYKSLQSARAECQTRLAQAAPKPAAPSATPTAVAQAAPRGEPEPPKVVETPRPAPSPAAPSATPSAVVPRATAAPSPTPLAVKPVRPSAPPADLLAAAQAYFNGEYDDAAQALARTSYAGGRELMHALVLRAAARYALYQLGGEKEDGLRQQALADIQACRRLDPAFSPDPHVFSPRFTQLFKSAR
jgi:hypothetical protein